MTNQKSSFQAILPSLLLFAILMGFFAVTLAPDISWANRGADGGDLIAAAATAGVAHPPGYPTYLILARLFQLLPWGTLAFRTNLMSAVFAAATATLIAQLVQKCHKRDTRLAHVSGWMAGLTLGLSPLFWSQAVITEVYTLHTLFITIILLFIPLCGVPFTWQTWRDRLGGILFGLALGNQLTVIFLLPAWLFWDFFQEGKEKERSTQFTLSCSIGRKLLRRFLWIIPGLLTYGLLVVWARSEPPVNWGNPTSWKNFWWLVSGQLYRDRVFKLDPVYLVPRIRNWAGLLQSQFGLSGLIIGLFGLFYGRPRCRRFYGITAWMFVSYSIFAVGYNSSDSYVLLLPAYQAFVLWYGLGVSALLERVRILRGGSWLASICVGVLFLFILAQTINNLPQVDASHDERAVNFGYTVLSTLPTDAIVITSEDQDTFTLWYYHYALGKRRDIIVLNEGLLAYDWYHETMENIYPTLNLTSPTTCTACQVRQLPELNQRPVCKILFAQSSEFTCVP